MSSSVEILFQNKNLVVANKAAGFLSVPSRHGLADARPVVGLELQKTLGINLRPVHRLDLEVSGILIFAKNAEAQRALSEAFEERTVKKIYQALTQGNPPLEPDLRWENLLVRGKRRSFVAPHGKTAVTLARYLDTLSSGELFWELEPLTGRPHQLRVHLSQNGYPILGDELYGSSKKYSSAGIALIATEIILPNSVSQKLDCPTRFVAPHSLKN